MATNVPQPTFGATGFVIPSAQAVLEGVIADIQAAFGGNLNLSASDTATLSTPQGQLATSQAAIIYSVYEMFLFYTTQTDPAYAVGRMQDAIARIYFLERNPAEPTVVEGLCTGEPGTPIPAGSSAIAVDGSIYITQADAEVGDDGQVTITFNCQTVGPVACPAGTMNRIYRAIPGWDTVTNPSDGVLGSDTESRSSFETRREASVAANSRGSLQAILGAVLEVSGVLDAYVTENTTGAPLPIGTVTLAAHSVYVAAIGGTDAAVAQAIWSKKAPGCAYNGNTTVTVEDTTGYEPPYPSYDVVFERPDSLSILFEVEIATGAQVPSNAETLIQNAIVAAFAGGDGGPRATIGTTLYASRFYAPVAALGSWVRIKSILVGSNNTASCQFTGSIATDVLTVSAIASGTLAAGQVVSDALGHVASGSIILTQLSGTPGSTGTYQLSNTQTVASQAMTSAIAVANEVAVEINQAPTIAAGNIQVSAT